MEKKLYANKNFDVITEHILDINVTQRDCCFTFLPAYVELVRRKLHLILS